MKGRISCWANLSQEQLSLIAICVRALWAPNRPQLPWPTSPGSPPPPPTSGPGAPWDWGGGFGLSYMSACRLLLALPFAVFWRFWLDFWDWPWTQLVTSCLCHDLPQPYLGNWSLPQWKTICDIACHSKKSHKWFPGKSSLVRGSRGGSQLCLTRVSCPVSSKTIPDPTFSFYLFLSSYHGVLCSAVLLLYCYISLPLLLHPSTLIFPCHLTTFLVFL